MKYKKGDLVIVSPTSQHPCFARYRGLVAKIIKGEDIRDSFDRSLVIQYILEWLENPDESTYWDSCEDITNLFQEDWLEPTTQAEYDSKVAIREAQKVEDFMKGMKETLHG